MVLMGCRLTHYLNKGKTSYFPCEWGWMRAQIKNAGKNPIHISKIAITFEWQKKDGKWGSRRWDDTYSTRLEPGGEETIPPEGLGPVFFRIPIDTELKSYTYKVGTSYEELIEGDWVDRGLRWGDKIHHILIKRAPSLNFQVFVSHSNHPEDSELIDLICELLRHCGITEYVSEKKAEPGVRLWSKIEKAIKTSDSILVLWTKRGAKSGDVREEIGIIVGMGKYEQIIPIAEVNLKGSLKGKEYSSLSRTNPKKAVLEAIEKILEETKKKPSKPSVTST